MSDLISREAALAALGVNHWARSILEKMPATKPQVVANISGGLLQGASADYPVDIYALDFDDVPSDDPENIILLDGDEVYLGQCACDIDEPFVRSVVEAQTLRERGCAEGEHEFDSLCCLHCGAPIPPKAPEPTVECANCSWKGDENEVHEIQDIFERVMPGEIMPAGECPICGALAHLIDADD